MSRKDYMQCRRRCKRLRKAHLKVERSLVSLDRSGETGMEDVRENLLVMRDRLVTLLELLQLDAWETRQECMASGTSLPPPSKSEGEGFQSLTTEGRQRLRLDLEAITDADTEAMVAQGVG
ncbi:hypothetical protein [Chromohalobacter sp. HP20-39]|uniref:hypothetical protein n=1 Tax=Chromohalobacter sp. HP20-39 TaxID=3079306 RepID=UPI00294AA6C9|nr:hypothetical protein [Chromohalobacter sp. HP20-39]MDV6319582.1 hypothetical protein [Chromohalobacter sp. HP20-39]